MSIKVLLLFSLVSVTIPFNVPSSSAMAKIFTLGSISSGRLMIIELLSTAFIAMSFMVSLCAIKIPLL